MSAAHNSIALRFFIAPLLCWITDGSVQAQATGTQRILVLNSYHKELPWTDAQVSGAREILEDQIPNLELYVEYMDTKRVFNDAYLRLLYQTYRLKYRQIELDAVITTDDNAFDFALQHRHEIFRDLPIVFCGIDDHYKSIQEDGRITGVVEALDIGPTIELAMQLRPGLRKVAVIADDTPMGLGQRDDVEAAARNYPNLEFVYFDGESLSNAELIERLRTLRPDSVALLTVWFRDKTGTYFPVDEVGPLLSASSPVPMFGIIDMYLGHGIVGGKLLNSETHGRIAAEMLVRILKGEEPSEIPVVVESVNPYMFDYTQLDRWGIGLSQLPPGSVVVNRPLSFQQAYEEFILPVTTIFVLLLGLLVVLALNVMRRRRAEMALRDSQENLSITLNSIGDGVVAADIQGRVIRMNPVAERLSGWSSEQAEGRSIAEVFRVLQGDAGEAIDELVKEVIHAGQVVKLSDHHALVGRDQGTRLIAQNGSPIRNAAGEIVGVVLVFRDVTEEHTLQERLRHSEKMQAIGELAGGIAHDFNNLLSGILGNAEMLSMSLSEYEEERAMAEEIVDASSRAADLTSQLLAFSRKGKLQTVSVDMHDILSEVGRLLVRSIDRRIEIRQRFRASQSTVSGDPTQLQNAILNLGVNARDAMLECGELTFATQNVWFDEEYCQSQSQEIRPGPYLEISVTDTGVGMSSEVRERIFEPFFTTKPPGAGTGLGLAGVYGCIQSHRGLIQVRSELGKGTTFKIALPLAAEGKTAVPAVGEREVFPGCGFILVVDDEETVRNYATKALQGLGYNSVSCADGAEAVDFFRHKHSDVDLVLLDLIMPKLSGGDTFKLMKQIDPDVRVLISSGFSHGETMNVLLQEGAMGVLHKPFRLDELSREVARHIRTHSK